jgi:hypothetical protein
MLSFLGLLGQGIRLRSARCRYSIVCRVLGTTIVVWGETEQAMYWRLLRYFKESGKEKVIAGVHR